MVVGGSDLRGVAVGGKGLLMVIINFEQQTKSIFLGNLYACGEHFYKNIFTRYNL